MPRSLRTVALAILIAASPAIAGGKAKFDWDALGDEFCRLSTAGDLEGMRSILTPSLYQAIEAARANPALPPTRTLFQSYSNEVPVCQAETRNAALVMIHRSMPGDAPPSWTEAIVVVPETDGTTRIDDVLFATRRSDTLRSRLDYFEATR